MALIIANIKERYNKIRQEFKFSNNLFIEPAKSLDFSGTCPCGPLFGLGII
jgi:hypothetical protein